MCLYARCVFAATGDLPVSLLGCCSHLSFKQGAVYLFQGVQISDGGKNCCQRLYARCWSAQSPIRRYPFLAYTRKGRLWDCRKHLFEKYDPKHGLVRAFILCCNVSNYKKHCCMCFSLSGSAVSFQVSASVGTTPYRQSKFRRSVSVLKAAAPFKCGHCTRYHKAVGFEPTTS